MIHIGICDDEAREREQIVFMVFQFSEEEDINCRVSQYSCGEDLLDSIKHGSVYDILILDIYMGISDGIAIAREIRTFDSDCPIIFATNSRERAIEGYGVHALQYLLKPIEKGKLTQALTQAINFMKSKQKKYICLSNKQGSYRICITDIIYIESKARVATIHTLKGIDYSFYLRLSDILGDLDYPCFIWCHKSYIVNMDYIRYISGNDIVLENGIEIPVSKKISEVKDIFTKYIGEQI